MITAFDLIRFSTTLGASLGMAGAVAQSVAVRHGRFLQVAAFMAVAICAFAVLEALLRLAFRASERIDWPRFGRRTYQVRLRGENVRLAEQGFHQFTATAILKARGEAEAETLAVSMIMDELQERATPTTTITVEATTELQDSARRGLVSLDFLPQDAGAKSRHL